ncbi:MAG: aldehyde dehydrogenase family protein [bacterium]
MSEKPSFDVKSSATGELVGTYALMDKDDIDLRVKKARQAFESWSQSTLKARRRFLSRAASILADDAERYAKIISDENGKTRVDALIADVFPSCDLLHYYSKTLHKHLAPVKADVPLLFPGRKAYYVFEPRGVVGVISPWNYPLSLSAGPSISAIAAGNAVVLKPSSQTSGCGFILEEVFQKAGLPEGVFQTVTGSGSVTGQALIDHPDLDMLFFTGSTEVGRTVNLKAAERLVPTIMELGGKDAAIVTGKADLGRAASSVAWGAFTNSGQTCIGIEMCLVERNVYEEFLKKILDIIGELRNGQTSGEIGAMTMRSQLELVKDQVADAREKGARVLTGGAPAGEGEGLYYPPTVLVDVTPDMKVMKDETFGPLLPVLPYDNVQEAIDLVNRGEYGLSGAVYSSDMEEARAIAGKIKTGSINVNDCLITYAVPDLPFGGAKNSGVGRYHGRLGLQNFCEIKSITEYKGGLEKEPFYYPMAPDLEGLLKNGMQAMFSRNPFKKALRALQSGRGFYKAFKGEKKKTE